ncbi:MAG: MgtC/SapB family protein [Firmicutes bacterium]|jgi:putative Mg2+ transporter-C (MgtC) family protein|nr:MgtC/SapB family protein [Bacillota bacterium]
MIISNLEMVIRLALAVALGAAVGLEREKKNQAAGLRTHIVVILGATLVMLISKYGFSDIFINTKDPARLAAQVVSGIGFLGAGMIIVNRNKIRGLTTAASLWTTACIGLGVGAGFYVPAIATTVLLVGTLSFVQYLEQHHVKKDSRKIYAEVEQLDSFMQELDEVLTRQAVNLGRVEILEKSYPDELDVGENTPGIVKVMVYLQLPRYTDCSFIISSLSKIEGVRLVEER